MFRSKLIISKIIFFFLFCYYAQVSETSAQEEIAISFTTEPILVTRQDSLTAFYIQLQQANAYTSDKDNSLRLNFKVQSRFDLEHSDASIQKYYESLKECDFQKCLKMIEHFSLVFLLKERGKIIFKKSVFFRAKITVGNTI